jgi:hypothetical protein
MVAGIIVAAVGDKLTITHPHGQADAAAIATVLDGPGVVLAGQVLFKRALFGRAFGRPPGRHRRAGCPGAARLGRVVTRAGHHGHAGAGGGGRGDSRIQHTGLPIHQPPDPAGTAGHGLPKASSG